MNQRPQAIFLSPRGFQLFEERLKAQREAHAQLCRDREIAHELSGDGWHDNPDFNRLQQLEANSTWKIHELEEVIANAQRVEVREGSRPTERVQIGSVVQLELYDPDTEQVSERVIEVVGYQESEPKLSCVSYSAPLAKAIMGLRAGDYQEAQLGGRTVDIEITALFRSRAAAGLSELP